MTRPELHRVGWVVAALTAALGACGGEPEFARPDRRLENTSWRMTALAGEPLKTPPGAAEQPTLTFKRGYASWSVGCNGFDHLYRTEGDRLLLRLRPKKVIGGCEPFEQPLRIALADGAMPFRREDRRMTIATPAGELELARVAYREPRLR